METTDLNAEGFPPERPFPIETLGLPEWAMPPAPGLYFGMPDEFYHQKFALSASGTKLMYSSELDWWARSALNPRYAEVLEYEVDTAAQMYGRALHCLVLEGRAAFNSHFVPPIRKSNYPDALDTMVDMRNMIERLNEGREKADRIKKSGTKEDLEDAILRERPATPIWRAIQEHYAEVNKGKTVMKDADLAEVEMAAAMITKDPNLKDIFTNGYPEVSIFYTCQHTGIPCKARFDWLGVDEVVDLKSFQDRAMRPIDEAVRREMNARSYGKQAVWYLDAASYIPAMIKAGRVFGEPEPSFLDALVKHKGKQFRFVFSRKGPAPLARARWFSPELGVYDIFKAENDEAKQRFAWCLQTFGSEPWISSQPTQHFTDDELSRGFF